MMQVCRNCQVLSEQTRDSSAFTSAMSLLKHVIVFNCEQHFSYFDSDYATSRLIHRISKGLLYHVDIGSVVDVFEVHAPSSGL
jgi:hypothetical protein